MGAYYQAAIEVVNSVPCCSSSQVESRSFGFGTKWSACLSLLYIQSIRGLALGPVVVQVVVQVVDRKGEFVRFGA